MHPSSILEIIRGTSSTSCVKLFCWSLVMAAVLPHTLPLQPDTAQTSPSACKNGNFSIFPILGLPLWFCKTQLCYENPLASLHHPLLDWSTVTGKDKPKDNTHPPARSQIFWQNSSQGQQWWDQVWHIYLIDVCWFFAAKTSDNFSSTFHGATKSCTCMKKGELKLPLGWQHVVSTASQLLVQIKTIFGSSSPFKQIYFFPGKDRHQDEHSAHAAAAANSCSRPHHNYRIFYFVFMLQCIRVHIPNWKQSKPQNKLHCLTN